ncbi:flavodoxin family protein [Rhodobacter ferrooxidans]|nr:NAD(P)H-dependent oxidoreductase [Rhodobacter sp. SW2]
MPDRSFLFLTSSARAGGNSESLARAAAAHLPQATPQVWIDLASAGLPGFHDRRGDAPEPLTGHMAEIAAEMQAASDIVLVAPVYWYALPAPAKLLLDHWSGWLDLPQLGFGDWIRARRLWLITTRADPAPDVADLPEAMVRRTAEWLQMAWGGALHGIADGPGEIEADPAAQAAARHFLAKPR